MAIQSRNTLKSWFETGDFPTQEQFRDLIDSMVHINENAAMLQTPNEGTYQLPPDNIVVITHGRNTWTPEVTIFDPDHIREVEVNMEVRAISLTQVQVTHYIHKSGEYSYRIK